MRHLTQQELQQSLAVVDLSVTDHAIGQMVNHIRAALQVRYNKMANIVRSSPIVDSKDNYDKLYYPKDTVTKSERYTRWIDDETMLRTQMTACIPKLLQDIAKKDIIDSLNLCPGIVYRRDVVDKTHVGEPHQMDVWRIKKGVQYNRQDLLELVSIIVDTVLPGVEWRYNETSHYYTKDGIEVEVNVNGSWMEILECGLALPQLLQDSGLDPKEWSGLALGIGLDRAVMLRKNITDIRVLRSENLKIASQMHDLEMYKPVSLQPQIKRDLSIAVDNEDDVEQIGDRIRELMGERVNIVEQISITSETAYKDLPKHVSERLGMTENMKNVLLRVVLCPLDRSMTSQEANEVYTHLYEKLHKGSVGYTI